MKTPTGEEITDQLLCTRFPRLFADRHANMRTTALCWGFEIGPGWMGLLYKAALKLEPLIEAYMETHLKERNPFPWFVMNSWYGIRWSIRHPLLTLRSLIEWGKVVLWLKTAEPWWPRASQIREKFGTLRFYLTSGTNGMYAIVDKAERQSSVTCEICGKPGKLRGQGWYYTRCLPCWKKEQK